jgi:hypothetical protein
MNDMAINNKYHRELFSGEPCVHQQKSDVKKGSNLGLVRQLWDDSHPSVFTCME